MPDPVRISLVAAEQPLCGNRGVEVHEVVVHQEESLARSGRDIPRAVSLARFRKIEDFEQPARDVSDHRHVDAAVGFLNLPGLHLGVAGIDVLAPFESADWRGCRGPNLQLAARQQYGVAESLDLKAPHVCPPQELVVGINLVVGVIESVARR